MRETNPCGRIAVAIVLLFCILVVYMPSDADEPTSTPFDKNSLSELHAILDDSDGKFSRRLRDTYLDLAEKEVREKCKLPDDFWQWLKSRMEIRAGLLAANRPVSPQAVRNLAEIRKALGAQTTDRYAHLALAVALSRKESGLEAARTPKEDVDTELVGKFADYMSKEKKTLLEVVEHAEEIAGEIGLHLPKKRKLKKFWTRLGVITTTFPPKQEASVIEYLKYIIGRYETKLPKFDDGGPEWPLFPLNKAPWILLMALGETRPLKECEYVWNHFTGKEKYEHSPKKKKKCPRIMTYSKYTSDYQKTEIRFRRSDWHPDSMPRIVEDGGVCGRQSQLARTTYNALGKPSVQMGQPHHSALIYFGATDKGLYFGKCAQSIAPLYYSKTNWYFGDARGIRVQNSSRVGVEFQLALALAANRGLKQYIDTRIALHIARSLPDTEMKRKVILLESVLDANPYNIDVWYELAQYQADNMERVNALLKRLDDLLCSSDMKPEHEETRNASEALEEKSGKAPDLKAESCKIASVVRMAVIEYTYRNALEKKKNLETAISFLKEEYARQKTVRRSPYLGTLNSLVVEYGICIHGIEKVKKSVTDWVLKEIEHGNTFSKTDRRKISGRILGILKNTKAAERVSWLQAFREAYEKSRIFKTKKNGKVTTDSLYSYLVEEQIKALRRCGKNGRKEAEKLKGDFEKAKREFETQKRTSP